MGGSRILFVCAGNTCRSPLAAALANGRLQGVTAESAGTYPGFAVAENSVSLASELAGVDISEHQPRDVRELELSSFDVVIALDESIAAELEAVPLPPSCRLVRWDVRDPYGETMDGYRLCAEQIAAALDELVG